MVNTDLRRATFSYNINLFTATVWALKLQRVRSGSGVILILLIKDHSLSNGHGSLLISKPGSHLKNNSLL